VTQGVEHVLALIKPDGVDAGIEALFRELATAYGLTILRRRMLTLTVEQITRTFHKSSAAYVAYMASGPSVALLLRGRYAHAHLARIKKAVRRRFGVSWRDTRNLLHHAEPGGEHADQLALCFPELAPLRYTAYADLDVRGATVRQLTELATASTLSWIAVTVPAEELSAIDDVIRGHRACPLPRLELMPAAARRTRIRECDVELIAYFPPFTVFGRIAALDPAPSEADGFVAWASAWGGAVAIGHIGLPPSSGDVIAVAEAALDAGCRLIVACHPRYSSQNSHQLGDLASERSMPSIGGSAGHLPAGSYSVGEREFEGLWNTLAATPRRGGWNGEHDVLDDAFTDPADLARSIDPANHLLPPEE
jgi:hypothetical protein